MNERGARQVLLAQAIETGDTEGKLLDPARRDEVDRITRQDAMRRSASPLPADEFLRLRAQRVLAEAGVREPGLVGLQEPGTWRPWIEWGLPLAALVLGVLTDVVGNPHRLDLMSLPLLGIVAWNLVIYLLLLLKIFLPSSQRSPLVASLGRWGSSPSSWQRRKPSLRVRIAAKFHATWLGATRALHAQRSLRVMHLAAAAWAAGVILSLLVRGLVVEYRVGWESTFLNAEQVHAILSVLRYPALLVLPFEPFTVADIAVLRFSQRGGTQGGAPWVWMYVSLLLIVVILPRLLLAAVAGWREIVLARSVPIDMDDPYFRRILSLLDSTRVQLALLAHRDEDRAVIHRLLIRDADAMPVLASSGSGDVLRLVDIVLQPPPSDVDAPAAPWWHRMRARLSPDTAPAPALDPVAAARESSDILVHVAGGAGDLEAARPLIEWFGKPVLYLRLQGVPRQREAPGVASESIDVEAFARCWYCERALLQAIRKLLPEPKTHGFDRVARAWDERNEERLRQSMLAVANHLLDAARQVQEVRSSALTVKSLLPAERQAQSGARQAAMDAMSAHVRESAATMLARLRHLHGVTEEEADSVASELSQAFHVRQSVNAQQAGLAGAASGAAMGASVDLITGGLTLGAAAALGALVGGGGAFIAAAWKNRAAPGGGTMVQLSDEMLMALAQAALLGYLAIIHARRGARPDVQAVWGEEIADSLEPRKDLFAGFWHTARTQPYADRIAQPLAHELGQAVGRVFIKLYGSGAA